MTIKSKNKNPKSTEFGPSDIIINNKEGSLFFKDNKNQLFKIKGDNVNINNDLIIFEGAISASKGFFSSPGIGQMVIGDISSQNINTFEVGIKTLEVEGSITPFLTRTAKYDLGSIDNPWRDLYLANNNIQFVNTGKGVGFSKIGSTFIIGESNYGLENKTSSTTDLDVNTITAISGTFNHIITDSDTIEFRNASSKEVEGFLKFDTTNGLQVQDKDRASTVMKVDAITATRNIITAQITASSNISASGELLVTGEITTGDDINVTGGNKFIKFAGSDGFGIGSVASETLSIVNADDLEEEFFGINRGVSPSVVYIPSSVVLDIQDATAATDASGDTGAIRTEGGASIAKNISVGTHITASGNISSSGTITATGYKLWGDTSFATRHGSGEIDLGDTDDIIEIHGTNIKLSAPVTASGNISSSAGTVITSRLSGGATGDQSGSLYLSGSLTFRDNAAVPAVSASTLYDQNGHLYYGGGLIGGYFLSASAAGNAPTVGYVKILPQNFVLADGSSGTTLYYNQGFEDDGSAFGIRNNTANLDIYAFKDIPFGWTAVGFRTYGSSTDTVTFHVYNMTDGSRTADGNTGTLNGAEITLATPTLSDADKYFGIHINPNSSADIVYGGYIKIEKR